MARLADEETKAKDMLDEKIRLQQLLSQDSEDLNENKAFSTRNREEIIKLQIKFSQQITLEDKLKIEAEKLELENDFYTKKNKEFEIDNVKLQQEIQSTIQKIDINALMKEIDIEDLRLLAQSNKQMNHAFGSLIAKWESIQKVDMPSSLI